MKNILFFFVLLACLVSCSVYQKSEGVKTEKLTVKVFQTLDAESVLARPIDTFWGTTDYNMVVKIVTYSEHRPLYDGKMFSDKFVMIGTWTYETTEHKEKTVPVYISIKEYERFKQDPRFY